MNINIKELIKNNYVQFLKYRQQHLYYEIGYENDVYSFPVPLEDLQDAEVADTEKAITLMRYIRKAIADRTFVKL